MIGITHSANLTEQNVPLKLWMNEYEITIEMANDIDHFTHFTLILYLMHT